MTDRPTSLSFDRIAERYDDTRGGRRRGELFARALEPLFARRGRTLEIGVGTGIVAEPLARGGRVVVGIDLSPVMLQAGRARLGARVAVGDALHLPFADASVDDVYSVWVLHLVSDVAAVLSEVARVLRPGGRYVVVGTSRPQPGDLQDVDPIMERMRVQLQGQARQDAEERVERLATDAGFRVSDRTFVEVVFDSEPPAQLIGLIEDRVYSMLWDLDEPTWARVVVPTIEALRALPGQDRPRPRRSVHVVLALERT